MMTIAYPLRREEREAISNFLGTKSEEVPFPPGAFCPEKKPPLSTRSSGSWTGWSPTFSNTRLQYADGALLTPSQIPKLKLKWAFGFPGDITAVRRSNYSRRDPVYRQREWNDRRDERKDGLPLLDVSGERAGARSTSGR